MKPRPLPPAPIFVPAADVAFLVSLMGSVRATAKAIGVSHNAVHLWTHNGVGGGNAVAVVELAQRWTEEHLKPIEAQLAKLVARGASEPSPPE